MIRSEALRRLYALVLALAVWFALALQFYLTYETALANGKSPLAAIELYLSFFTVLTNFVVAITLTFAVFSDARTPSPGFTTAIAVYIGIVGVIYYVALKDVWDPKGPQYVADKLLHYFLPAVFVLYWLLFVPKGETRWKTAIWLLLYPAAYLAFALWRGAQTGKYPYYFIDVAKLGAQQTAVNCAIVAAAFLGAGLIFVALDKLLGLRKAAI